MALFTTKNKMRTIIEYLQSGHLTANSKIDDDGVIPMDDCKSIFWLADIFANGRVNINKSAEIKLLKDFLKGKHRQTGMTLAFGSHDKDYYPYYHIHRYVDMHNITFAVTGTPTIDWPNDPSYWKNHKILFSDIDDRLSKNDIFERFIINLSNNLTELTVKP